MTGSHIDTVRHRRALRRQPRRARRPGGRRDARAARRRAPRTRSPSPSSPTRRAARFAPDMLGSLVFVGGMALEEALDVRAVDDGARLGDELDRIGYAGPLPCPTAVAPHAYVELHIEQGPILEDEGITIGVVEGVQGISWTELTIVGRSAHAGTTPMRDAPRRRLRRRRDRHVRPPAGRRARRRPGRHRRALRGRARTSSTSCADRGDADRRPAQHRRRRAAARPSEALAAEVDRLAAAEGVTVTTPLAGPLRAGRLRPGRRSTSSRRRPGGSATRRGGCRAAPATTPRCWPGSARRR